MNKKPMISVVVPVYNAQRSLNRCVHSILQYDNGPLEVLLIDDGSTDDSAALCDEFAKHSCVRVIHKQNAGVSSARNVGLDEAHGEYVAFVDSDDRLTTNALSIELEAAEQHDADMVIGGYQSIYPDGVKETAKYHCVPEERVYRLDSSPTAEQMNDICDLAGFLYLFQCWGKLYRRDWIDGLRFNENIAYGEDSVFISQLLQRPSTLVALPQALYQYEETQTGLASGFKLDKPSNIQWQHGERLKLYRFGQLTIENQQKLCVRLANDVLWALTAVRDAPATVNDADRLRYIGKLADSPLRGYYLRGLKSAASTRMTKLMYWLNNGLLWRWFIKR